MKDTEALAIAQAMHGALGAMVKTKDAGNLRGQVDARIIEDFNDDGIKSRDLRVNGIKVGSIAVTASKPSTKAVVQVEDYDALMAWLDGKPGLVSSIIAAGMKYIEKYVTDTGEVPDGCSATTIEDRGGRVTGTRITGCKPDAVADALGGSLPDAIAGLLGGVNE